jgi:hypothetical protein
LIIDHSQRLTTGRWKQAVERADERLNQLSHEDKLAIALHDFAAVSATDFVPFDYCDGPNGVRGHQGATAFPSALSVAASFDRTLAHRYGVALGQEVPTAGKNAILAPGLDIIREPQRVGLVKTSVRTRCSSARGSSESTHHCRDNGSWTRGHAVAARRSGDHPRLVPR